MEPQKTGNKFLDVKLDWDIPNTKGSRPLVVRPKCHKLLKHKENP
jgi:hypothetical protein